MNYGIGQQVDDASKLSIEELMRLQSMDPSFVYALALQEKQNQQAAASNQAALNMQTPSSTLTGQMEQDLASKRAPGIQMAGQRSIPQPPQMAQGISNVPAPNMQTIGRAQGGIIGYNGEEESFVELEAMRAEYDAMSPMQQFFIDKKSNTTRYPLNNYDRNEDSERLYTGLDLNSTVTKGDLRAKGMTEENIAAFTRSDNEIRRQEERKRLEEEEKRFQKEREMAQAEYNAGVQLDAQQAAKEAARIAEAGGVMADAGNPNIPNNSAIDSLLYGVETAVGKAGEVVESIRDTAPEVLRSAAVGVAQMPQTIKGFFEDNVQAMTSENGLAGLIAREREKNAGGPTETEAVAQATQAGPPTREEKLQELLGPALAQQQANQGISSVEPKKEQKTPADPKDPNSRSFMDKAMGIAEILGRGAGASKGFEGAKIVEESSRIRAAEADRAAKMAEQNALIEARKAELDTRLASDTAIAMQELDSELYATITQEVESGALSEELATIEQELRDKHDAFSILGTNFFVKDGVVDKQLAAAKLKIIMREFKNRKGVLASLSGIGGQGGGQGVGESVTDAADYFEGG
tara:strand:- start:3134 stop:4870 length:1737 start_codon:yes stop_codon:yes gene_type:complete